MGHNESLYTLGMIHGALDSGELVQTLLCLGVKDESVKSLLNILREIHACTREFDLLEIEEEEKNGEAMGEGTR